MKWRDIRDKFGERLDTAAVPAVLPSVTKALPVRDMSRLVSRLSRLAKGRKALRQLEILRSVTLSREKTNQPDEGEITVKNYRRNRTETLSLRLTAEEKQVLKALAEKRNLSMTDYILLSALHYSAGEHYRHALKTLEQIRTELLALQRSNPGDAVCDALEKQMQLYDAALAAIRCT